VEVRDGIDQLGRPVEFGTEGLRQGLIGYERRLRARRGSASLVRRMLSAAGGCPHGGIWRPGGRGRGRPRGVRSTDSTVGQGLPVREPGSVGSDRCAAAAVQATTPHASRRRNTRGSTQSMSGRPPGSTTSSSTIRRVPTSSIPRDDVTTSQDRVGGTRRIPRRQGQQQWPPARPTAGSSGPLRAPAECG
jgi:hypothetical protein